MTALIATTYGQGPFVPVVTYRGRAYQVGTAMEDIQEAMATAIGIAETIRNDMRSPGFEAILAKLP